jgi:hypothetical protein
LCDASLAATQSRERAGIINLRCGAVTAPGASAASSSGTTAPAAEATTLAITTIATAAKAAAALRALPALRTVPAAAKPASTIAIATTTWPGGLIATDTEAGFNGLLLFAGLLDQAALAVADTLLG